MSELGPLGLRYAKKAIEEGHGVSIEEGFGVKVNFEKRGLVLRVVLTNDLSRMRGH